MRPSRRATQGASSLRCRAENGRKPCGGEGRVDLAKGGDNLQGDQGLVRAQIAPIGEPQRIGVAVPSLPVATERHWKRHATRPEQHRHEEAGHAPVEIGKRVNVHEVVRRPSSCLYWRPGTKYDVCGCAIEPVKPELHALRDQLGSGKGDVETNRPYVLAVLTWGDCCVVGQKASCHLAVEVAERVIRKQEGVLICGLEKRGNVGSPLEERVGECRLRIGPEPECPPDESAREVLKKAIGRENREVVLTHLNRRARGGAESDAGNHGCADGLGFLDRLRKP